MNTAIFLTLSLFFAFVQPCMATYQNKILDTYQLQKLVNETNNREELVDRYEKLFNFSRNFGALLIDQIQREQILVGPQLNTLHQSLSAFLDVATQLEKSLRTSINAKEPHQLAQWLLHRIKLVEHYKTVHSLYLSDTKMRRILWSKLNYSSYGLEDFKDFSKLILSEESQELFEDQLQKFETSEKLDSKIVQEIQKSITYQLAKNNKSLDEIYSRDIYWSDVINSITTNIGRGLSWAYGSSVGNVEWGPGGLYKNQELISRLTHKLRPLDLMFEKKKFKLTDYTIPGHWGHVAVWLGSQEQLQELGIWNHSELDPFREDIKRGNSIFEVRRWGLQFENILNFTNLDEIAVTRLPDVLKRRPREILKIYQNLAAQKDKKYDFTFNVLATDRTTCTEIIYLSYGHYRWPYKEILGRMTISPNNLAELLFYKNSPMQFIDYHTASSNDRLKTLSMNDFAKTLDFYLTGHDSQGAPIYKKKDRECKIQRFRRGGAIKLRTVCKDKFTRKTYQDGNLTHFSIIKTLK